MLVRNLYCQPVVATVTIFASIFAITFGLAGDVIVRAGLPPNASANEASGLLVEVGPSLPTSAVTPAYNPILTNLPSFAMVAYNSSTSTTTLTYNPTTGVASSSPASTTTLAYNPTRTNVPFLTAYGSSPPYLVATPQIPDGTVFHQVVNRYFDSNGKEIEVKSATHIFVDMDCHPGRNQQDQIAGVADDGKGNVVFTRPAFRAAVNRPASHPGVDYSRINGSRVVAESAIASSQPVWSNAGGFAVVPIDHREQQDH